MKLTAFPAWSRQLQADLDSDVLVVCQPLFEPLASVVFGKIAALRRRRRVTVVARTSSGSARTAYRIARDLRHAYSSVVLYVPSLCINVGSLLLVAADEIAVGAGARVTLPLEAMESLRAPRGREVDLAAVDSPSWEWTYFLDELPWLVRGSPEPWQ